MSECSICLEKFNKTSRKKIICKTCLDDENTIVCTSCASKYILDNCRVAKCMICNVEWDKEFLFDYFTKKFINNDFKYHQEQYLYEEQIARLPDTQNLAIQRKQKNELKIQLDILKKEKNELMAKLNKIKKTERIVFNNINLIDRGIINPEEKVKFTFKCPVDNCNGFLNHNFNCGICSKNICKYCMEELTEDHECNEDKKKTVELLKKDTKPCPKCGQLIYKIDGCNQMWCLKCHTTFNWRTGIIDNSDVHNPEYFRWMRENNHFIERNRLDIVNECNYPTYDELIRQVRIYYPFIKVNNYRPSFQDKPQVIILSNIYRLIRHLEAMDMGNMQLFKERNLEELRINYLINEITVDIFKRKIQIINKKYEKIDKVSNVYNLLIIQLREYIINIMKNYNSVEEGIEDINKILENSEKIRLFANKSFKRIGKIYNMTYPGIDNKFLERPNWEYYINSRN